MRLIFLFIIFALIGTKIFGQETMDFYPIDEETIESTKTDRSYAYMKNLDSLLRESYKVVVAQQPKEVKREDSWLTKFLSSDTASIMGWIIAAILVLLVVYQFLRSEGILVNRRKLQQVEEEEAEEEVSPTTNFGALIQNALAKNDYRSSVKYQYLNTLSKLHHKEIIHLEAGKTNYDYLYKLPYELKTDFTPLLHIYEYVWYGEKTPTVEQYKEIAVSFEKFNTQI